MGNLWVCNTSPLILLHRIGQLELLVDLCEKLVIPKGVIDEVFYHREDITTWDLLFSSNKVEVLKDSITIEESIVGWDLGRGESEVLSWAVNYPEYEAILDDLDARRCARSFNVLLRGTVGIILLAKYRNRILKATPLIESLINAGLRCDLKWVKDALELVGEKIE